MNTQHTSGPWSVHGQAIYAGEVFLTQCWDETSKELPEYANAIGGCPVPENAKEAQANARLIAAAPELLEALNAMLAAMNNSKQWASMEFAKQADDAKRLARTAIAKATQP